ncbi:cell division protein ZipA C-terminal FtsZ-binding domain-containing protein [Psychrobacter sp. I-STPA10]|uniref:cell division protein ZipA C-terminal FtsZ-binding domain-containing protein n=1 Tax=Psychrobacter sp. I-STPA10 TaxID=2585769 RepID=UPI001E30FECE|nr:cell division protein ZipA C-terminal FtsZ-binding domain-containing protein [Psychrobacter sp. I-STPA10]
MTTTQIILIVVAVFVMLAGLYFIYRGIKRREVENEQALVRDKNGIPILPRHERNIVDPPDFDDTVGGETVITPDRSHLKAVVDEDVNHSVTAADTQDFPSNTLDEPNVDVQATNNQPTFQQTVTQPSTDEQHQQPDALENTPDLFSSLASATASITPVVETADEPEFKKNSPVLDKHLLSTAEQDQNSPLNNATENVNITLAPADGTTGISGQTLLAIVDKFGMKYGAMNMFHRYQNKDGTGILWFSMMGVTEEGVAPFDLNTLPKSTYDGLVLFLSLPHPKALHGFDTMISIATLMAKQLNMVLLDEHNEPLTTEQRHQLRLQVQTYQQNQH